MSEHVPHTIDVSKLDDSDLLAMLEHFSYEAGCPRAIGRESKGQSVGEAARVLAGEAWMRHLIVRRDAPTEAPGEDAT